MNNIETIARDKCTGCGACANKCSFDAIQMQYDSEGFIFPTVDAEKCIDCGMCLKYCPVEKPLPRHTNPETWAVMADTETRLKSSSGGMFSLLANVVFGMGGVVCGARYSEDYQTVYHAFATNADELAPLRGSKYVQSETRNTYRETKDYLKSGTPVLYTGTPCQIAGLYNYLGREYDNLYTADLVCHGSNSVTAYRSFLREFTEGKEIERVDFRDKKHYEWSSPTVVYLKDGTVKKRAWNEGTWYEGFLQGIINRKSCYECPYTSEFRVADVTLADAWQVHRINPKFDDRKGTSLVLVNSPKGKKLFAQARKEMMLCEEIPLEIIRKYNGHLNKPTREHPSRKFFFSHLEQKGYHTSLWYGKGMHFDVGIVGWWFASNYGSSLTYFALASILADMGKQVLFIPIPKVNGTPWEPETKQTIDFLAKRFKIGRDRTFSKMKEFNQFCDSFMVGSDQMWTPSATELVGYTFFLDFAAPHKKKIAFSTSFGHSNFDADDEMRETVKDYLKRFDAISVREHSGIEICKREFDIDVEQVLDPVFLCTRERYETLLEGIDHKLPKKYLLCYILDPTPEKEAAARYIAEKKGLEIITVLGMKEYAWAKDQWHTGTVLPKVTTEELLYYVSHCDHMMTDSHHGVCMGIIFEREYTALPNPNRGVTRFEAVAKSLGLESRLLYDPARISEHAALDERVDYASVRVHMEAEQKRTRDWLDAAFAKPTVPAEETVHTLNAKCRGLEYDLTNITNALNAKCARLQKERDEAVKRLEDVNAQKK